MIPSLVTQEKVSCMKKHALGNWGREVLAWEVRLQTCLISLALIYGVNKVIYLSHESFTTSTSEKSWKGSLLSAGWRSVPSNHVTKWLPSETPKCVFLAAFPTTTWAYCHGYWRDISQVDPINCSSLLRLSPHQCPSTWLYSCFALFSSMFVCTRHVFWALTVGGP